MFSAENCKACPQSAELVNKVCCEWEVSIRRACGVLLVDTSTYHYKSRRRGQADLEKRYPRR